MSPMGGFALQENLEESVTVHGQVDHRVLILLGPMSIYILNWIGGWDIWTVHQHLLVVASSELLGVSCQPQRVSI